MPLLSLPLELLLEILEDFEFDLVSEPALHNRGKITIRSVASTCRLLRSISTRIIYKTLRVSRLRDLEALPGIFASNQNIPSSVRHLAFGFPSDSVHSANKWPSKNLARTSIDRYRHILQSCNNIRTLYIEAGDKCSLTECRLDSYGLHSDGMSALLEYIDPEFAPRIERLFVQRLNLKRMFSHFGKLESFSNLKTLWLTRCDGTLGNPLVHWKSGLKLFPSLPSVQEFHFQLQLPTLSEEAEVALGEHIALMIPNVNTLTLDTSMHCIHGALTTYAKQPSNIKNLQLDFPQRRQPSQTTPDFSRIHLCDAIAGLSSGLVTFWACIGSKRSKSTLPLCHKMFDGNWPHLLELWYGGYSSVCKGIDRDQLRENLNQFAKSKPTAELSIFCGAGLLNKPPDNSTYHLADTETFSNFGSGRDELEPVILPEDDADDWN